MMITYFTVTLTIIIVILAINLLMSIKKQTKSVMDVISANPKFKEMKEFFEIMQSINEDGTDEDEIPDGYGDFGYELTNPIPTNTTFGSTSYLARLKTMNNTKVDYQRVGSFYSSVSDHPVDGYKISVDGKEIAILYISCYNKKNSEKLPKNFKF